MSRRGMSTPVPVLHQENFDEYSRERVNEKIDPIIRNSQKLNIAQDLGLNRFCKKTFYKVPTLNTSTKEKDQYTSITGFIVVPILFWTLLNNTEQCITYIAVYLVQFSKLITKIFDNDFHNDVFSFLNGHLVILFSHRELIITFRLLDNHNFVCFLFWINEDESRFHMCIVDKLFFFFFCSSLSTKSLLS